MYPRELGDGRMNTAWISWLRMVMLDRFIVVDEFGNAATETR